jgi:hypothetical protein
MDRRWGAAGSAVAAIGLVGLLLGACSSGSSATTQQPKVPTFTKSAAPTSVRVAAPVKSCTSVAVAGEVDGVVGHQLPGSAGQVVGIAEPSIGRVGRLDCYYGVPPGQPVTAAAISIGIATYSDEQSAQRRATLTINAARQGGASTSNVKVGSQPAVLIAGAKDQEVVVAAGNRTVLVSALNGVLDPNKTGQTLITLAQRAINAGG